jgi:hypothetical protein
MHTYILYIYLHIYKKTRREIALEICELQGLLEKTEDGMRLTSAAGEGISNDELKLLYEAGGLHDTVMIEETFRNKGRDGEQQKMSLSQALMMSAELGNLPSVKLLIECQADVHFTNADKMTVIHMAV